MDARFYNSDDIDIERLASDLVNAYVMQGYHAQQVGNKDQMMVQIKKGGDFEALIGMQAALSLTLQKNQGGVLAMMLALSRRLFAKDRLVREGRWHERAHYQGTEIGGKALGIVGTKANLPGYQAGAAQERDGFTKNDAQSALKAIAARP